MTNKYIGPIPHGLR